MAVISFELSNSLQFSNPRQMNSKYILSEIASQILRILRIISADRNPSAAIKMLEKLKATCQILAENPDWVRSERNWRPWMSFVTVGRYVIFYRPNGNGIEVARFLHSSRDLNTHHAIARITTAITQSPRKNYDSNLRPTGDLCIAWFCIFTGICHRGLDPGGMQILNAIVSRFVINWKAICSEVLCWAFGRICECVVEATGPQIAMAKTTCTNCEFRHGSTNLVADSNDSSAVEFSSNHCRPETLSNRPSVESQSGSAQPRWRGFAVTSARV